MLQQLKPNIWQLEFAQFGSAVYLLKLDGKNILIDTSTRQNRTELVKDLQELNLNQKT